MTQTDKMADPQRPAGVMRGETSPALSGNPAQSSNPADGVLVDAPAQPDEDYHQFQRDRIAEARRHDAQQAKPKLTDGEQSRPGDCSPAQQLPEGFMEAFYEMAAMLGIEGAQAKSPEQVYREQVKPALERLQQRATDAEAAYLNMRQWAEQNGLDTTARNAGVGVLPGQQLTDAHALELATGAGFGFFGQWQLWQGNTAELLRLVRAIEAHVSGVGVLPGQQQEGGKC